ncbi:MAG: hypothetical protein H6643_16270 [Caldilineaceae bacterium]|nr:hypothetical protein [Caldilineaceae bacterium]
MTNSTSSAATVQRWLMSDGIVRVFASYVPNRPPTAQLMLVGTVTQQQVKLAGYAVESPTAIRSKRQADRRRDKHGDRLHCASAVVRHQNRREHWVEKTGLQRFDTPHGEDLRAWLTSAAHGMADGPSGVGQLRIQRRGRRLHRLANPASRWIAGMQEMAGM